MICWLTNGKGPLGGGGGGGQRYKPSVVGGGGGSRLRNKNLAGGSTKKWRVYQKIAKPAPPAGK